jgi:chromosome segregation ATPase
MEKRINELEEKEVDLNKQIQHRIDIAEEAKLNCDRALLKEDQYIKEIQRLKNSLTENTSKFSEKSEQSLSLIVSKYETEKQKLLKEIDMLEVSNTEARNQVERAIRDKKTMEMRLERLSKQIPEDQERINLIIEDLTTRLNNSEREKDEIALKYEKLSDKNNREQNKIEKDKECLQIQLDDVYRRVRRSERELEDTKEDHVKLLNKVSEYEHQIKQAKEEKEKKEQEYLSEIQIITQKYDTKVKELSNNLENATNSYSKVSLEYQQLLSEQRKMSDKWKMESQEISDHYEVIITDLRSQIKRAATKIDELTQQQSKVAILKNELLSQVNEEKKEQSKLQILLKSADERAETFEQKIKELLIKQNEIIQEKKQLQRAFDRVIIEKERLARENELTKNIKHPELFKVHELTSEFEDEDDLDYNDDYSKLEAELEKVKTRSQYREYSILQ